MIHQNTQIYLKGKYLRIRYLSNLQCLLIFVFDGTYTSEKKSLIKEI